MDETESTNLLVCDHFFGLNEHEKFKWISYYVDVHQYESYKKIKGFEAIMIEVGVNNV